MADSAIGVSPGVGAYVDTFTQAGGDHRQAVVVGDPVAAYAAGVSAVGALDVGSQISTPFTGSITAAAQTLGPWSVAGYSVALVTIRGTYAGLDLKWELSDDGGTNWFPALAKWVASTNSPVTSTGAISNFSVPMLVNVAGWTHIRLVSNSFTSGSASVSVTLMTLATDVNPSVGIYSLPVSDSRIVNGANVASVSAGGALLVQEVPETDGSAAISIAANATASGSNTSLNGADTAIIQLTGTFVATVQVQVTADGTNWVNVTGSNNIINAATGAYLASGNMTATGIYFVNIAGMSGVRVITTAYTSGTVTGTVRVTAGGGATALSGVSAVTVSSGSLTANQSVNVAQMNGVATTMGNGVAGTGVQRVAIASDNTAFTVNTTPTTPTASIVNSAATTNGTVVKGSAGTLYSVTASNTGAAAAYLKFHNSATVTAGTTAVALTITLPAGGTVNVPFGSQGMRFGTGICLSITNLAADTDTTAIAASQVKVLTSYI